MTWKEAGAGAYKIRERTFRDYLDLLKRHVLPTLGDVRLDALRAVRIEAEVVARLRDRGHLRTARLAVCALSRVMRSAVKDPTLGLVGNPCEGVEIGRSPRRAIQPLTADEQGKFREAIRGSEHEALWLSMMLTSLGPGEVLALGWEHLDLGGGTLRVTRTLDCKAHRLVEDTKRPSRRRVVPLVAELRNVLRERWMALGRPTSGLVFADADGEPLDLDNLRARHFRPALESAKIARPVRIYDLRHGFATAALEAGADTRTVADLMGHSSTRTTLDVYQHISDERKRGAVERIAELLQEVHVDDSESCLLGVGPSPPPAGSAHRLRENQGSTRWREPKLALAPLPATWAAATWAAAVKAQESQDDQERCARLGHLGHRHPTDGQKDEREPHGVPTRLVLVVQAQDLVGGRVAGGEREALTPQPQKHVVATVFLAIGIRAQEEPFRGQRGIQPISMEVRPFRVLLLERFGRDRV